VPRAATRAAAANLGLGCVSMRLCDLGACGLQSTFLVSQWQPRRCPTRLFGNQHCQWPTPGRELVPCSLGGLGISSIDGFGPVWPPGHLRGNPARGKLSGPPPNPSSLVGMTLGVAGTGAGPAGSAGDNSCFPAASNGGLTGGTPGDGPKRTVDRLLHFSHARFSGLCASKH